MALRLRKDVQKASYYVWFLGAEESHGLRGPRILHSAIPYLVDRARELEPIKVTLQVSHKGMKIVQVRTLFFNFHRYYVRKSTTSEDKGGMFELGSPSFLVSYIFSNLLK